MNTRNHEVSGQGPMNVPHTKNPERLCPDSMSYLGINIPICLVI